MMRGLALATAVATRSLGVRLGQLLPAGAVLLLQGDLGTGKTTLVQGLGAGLGIRDTIDSPTFTLINEYHTGRVPLYHMDLYRLEAAETASLYPEMYWEGLEVAPGIVAIEWADRLPYRPADYLRLDLALGQPTGRTVTMTAIGARSPALLAQIFADPIIAAVE